MEAMILGLGWGVACSSPSPQKPEVAFLEDNIIFQGSSAELGEDGYPVFRIPSVVSTPTGVIVAFAEGRPSFDDPGSGEIDLVMKRSLDGGTSWSALEVLVENGSGDVHNPTAVCVPLSEDHARIWLFYSRRPQSAGGEFDIVPGLGEDSDTLWAQWSEDDGLSWSAAQALTAQVKDAAWGIASAGPGLATVTATGQIVVPGWYSLEGETGSFVFFSTDQGESWQRAGLPEMGTDESQIIELRDGRWLLDARQGVGETRQLFYSDDAGASWSAGVAGLPMVPVMSGVLRYPSESSLLLHTGVATTSRVDARLWLSEDEGESWAHETIFAPGFAQYTVPTVLSDGTVGVMYEALGEDANGTEGFNIHFARMNLAYLQGS